MTTAAGESRVEGSVWGDEREVGVLPEADSIVADPWRLSLDGVARGEPEALDRLYELSSRSLFGLALWRTGAVEDANDVVQEVFLRVVAERERLARVERPRAWLLGLAHHAAVDLARRRKRRAATPLDDVPFLVAPAADRERALDAARASRLVARLPSAQRDAVYLRHFEECSFAEIGRITGVPLFTAASRYRLGMRKLRQLLEREP